MATFIESKQSWNDNAVCTFFNLLVKWSNLFLYDFISHGCRKLLSHSSSKLSFSFSRFAEILYGFAQQFLGPTKAFVTSWCLDFSWTIATSLVLFFSVMFLYMCCCVWDHYTVSWPNLVQLLTDGLRWLYNTLVYRVHDHFSEHKVPRYHCF